MSLKDEHQKLQKRKLKALSSIMPTRQTVAFLLVVFLSMPGLANCFGPTNSGHGTSITHHSITQKAILRKTAEVCRDIAAAEGRDFNLTIDDSLSVTQVQRACSSISSSASPISANMFQHAINEIKNINAGVDISYALLAKYHFHNEAFQDRRGIMTKGISTVKANVRFGNFVAARQSLGQICHILQDFYSHSNWVELGKTTPYSALIRADQPLENLAGPDTPICKSCTGKMCANNILPEVLSLGLLTSGYFNIMSPVKPAGKCSHGGQADKTSTVEPVGGINKDAVYSAHGSFHKRAANLAVDATMELLEDIRVAVGDKNFLRHYMAHMRKSANITTAGNLRRINLNTGSQTGLWNISINSTNTYTVKVRGQSSMNFIYDIVEVQEGSQGGVSPKEGRPIAGANVTLLVTVTGSDTVTVTEVTLFNSSGLTEINGSIQPLGTNNFLVRFSAVPAGEFAVRLTGQDTSSTSRSTLSTFQRQALTQIKTSSLCVTARADITIEPNSTTFIHFTVSSDTPGTFTVQVNNDHNYPSTSPSNVTVGASSGGKANGTVTLTVPAGTVSGTDVTLTIEAKNATATEINYAVLQFSVVTTVPVFKKTAQQPGRMQTASGGGQEE